MKHVNYVGQRFGRLLAVGYSKENCVAACRICNCAKSELSLIEFKDWIKRTAKNLEII